MEKKEFSARDFVDAKDVKGNILYRKDDYLLGYLRVYFYNLELKSKPEKQSISKRLTMSFRDNKEDFDYFSLPREIDLDKYKELLKEKHSNMNNLGKRHILAKMIVEGIRLSTSGENFEHQHFIKIWKMKSDKAEEEIIERLKDYKNIFAGVGIETKILNEQEILKLCNLFGNSLQASYEPLEKNTIYTPIPIL